MLDYLSHRIAQPSSFITLYQTPCTPSLTKACFKIIKHAKIGTPFRIDRQVEDDISNSAACGSAKLEKLVEEHGAFQSNYGTVFHCSVSSRLN